MRRLFKRERVIHMCMCCIVSAIVPGVPAITGAGIWIKAKMNKNAGNNLERLAIKRSGEVFRVKVDKPKKVS